MDTKSRFYHLVSKVADKSGFDEEIAREVVNHYKHLPIEGRRVLDLGMNYGAFCLWALMNDAGQVYGLEPHPDSFSKAKRLRAIAGEELGMDYVLRWHMFNVAVTSGLSDEPVVLQISKNSKNLGAASTQRRKKTRFSDSRYDLHECSPYAINDLIGDVRPHSIKIDIEGAEYDVLPVVKLNDECDTICGEFHFSGATYGTPWKTQLVTEVIPALSKQGFLPTTEVTESGAFHQRLTFVRLNRE